MGRNWYKNDTKSGSISQPRSQAGGGGEPGGSLSHKLVSRFFVRSPRDGAGSGKGLAPPAKYTNPPPNPNHPSPAGAHGCLCPFTAQHPPRVGGPAAERMW